MQQALQKNLPNTPVIMIFLSTVTLWIGLVAITHFPFFIVMEARCYIAAG